MPDPILGRARRRRRIWSFAAILAGLAAAGPLVIFFLLASAASAPPSHDLSRMRLVNYYPAAHPFALMWTSFDEQAIDRDFARAHAIGFTTVEIFVPTAEFGFPTPNAEMTARLARVVADARRHRLTVGLGLFDRFTDYGDVEGSRTWIDQILRPFRDDPTIAFVDPHNEVDPSDSSAVRWLSEMMTETRKAAPEHPIVVSSPGRFGAAGLGRLRQGLGQQRADLYSLHYYGDPALLPAELDRATAAVGTGKLYLGEVGYSTASKNPATLGLPPDQAAQEAQQQSMIVAAVRATRDRNLPAPGVWTLNDFSTDGTAGLRANPVRASLERSFGLARVDGSAKPALTALHAYFATGGIAPVAAYSFTEPASTSPETVPLGWRVFDPGHGRFTWSPTTGHDAPGAAMLSHTAAGANDKVPAFYLSPYDVVVQPGRIYTVSVWAKGHAATGETRVAISWYDADGRYLAQRESGLLTTGTTPWMRLSVVQGAPPRAAAFEIHLKSSANTGSVWFDDVSVE